MIHFPRLNTTYFDMSLEYNVRLSSTEKPEATATYSRLKSTTLWILYVPLQRYSKPFASSARASLYAECSSGEGRAEDNSKFRCQGVRSLVVTK